MIKGPIDLHYLALYDMLVYQDYTPPKHWTTSRDFKLDPIWNKEFDNEFIITELSQHNRIGQNNP